MDEGRSIMSAIIEESPSDQGSSKAPVELKRAKVELELRKIGE
jgi:hypothetical protein